MARRYSEQEIDEAVLESQNRRQDERLTDPHWQLVEDEWSDVLGPTWQFGATRSDDEWGPDSAQQQMERGPR